MARALAGDNIAFSIAVTKLEQAEDGSRYIEGIASTPDQDVDDEVIVSKGLDCSYLDTGKGHLNWEHKDEPAFQIGIIKAHKITPRGLWIRARLFDDNENADDAWKTMKANPDHGYGFSIQGKTVERDDRYPKRITKARVTAIALTSKPVNPNTYADVCKAFTKGMGNFEIVQSPSGPFAVDAVLVEAFRENGLDIAKALSAGYSPADGSPRVGGAALRIESLQCGRMVETRGQENQPAATDATKGKRKRKKKANGGETGPVVKAFKEFVLGGCSHGDCPAAKVGDIAGHYRQCAGLPDEEAEALEEPTARQIIKGGKTMLSDLQKAIEEAEADLEKAEKPDADEPKEKATEKEPPEEEEEEGEEEEEEVEKAEDSDEDEDEEPEEKEEPMKKVRGKAIKTTPKAQGGAEGTPVVKSIRERMQDTGDEDGEPLSKALELEEAAVADALEKGIDVKPFLNGLVSVFSDRTDDLEKAILSGRADNEIIAQGLAITLKRISNLEAINSGVQKAISGQVEDLHKAVAALADQIGYAVKGPVPVQVPVGAFPASRSPESLSKAQAMDVLHTARREGRLKDGLCITAAEADPSGDLANQYIRRYGLTPR